MFMKEFNLEQRKAICKLCYYMVVADHQVRDCEHEILDDLELYLSLSGQISRTELRHEPDLSIFDTPRSRVAVMMQLFAVAYVDRQIQSDELEVLRRYARALGISGPKFEEIATWGKRHCVLFEQAREIIGN
jgi:uncharacterized tellurite resistance protein B-like protein